jgi:AraC-like DNA-binding protein
MDLKTEPGRFERPVGWPRWQGLVGWQSRGGPARRHPAQALPAGLDVVLPPLEGRPVRVELTGVFALYADAAKEGSGTVGASLTVEDSDGPAARFDLVNGRHYGDATDLNPLFRSNGDGTSLETVGTVRLDGAEARVDRLLFDLPAGRSARSVGFRSLPTASSFVLFDAQYVVEPRPVCPFSGRGKGMSLAEVGSVLRVRDRAGFDRALDQFVLALRSAEDLDEARSLALTFLAVVAAAMLEMGAPRSFPQVQLDAAREMLACESPVEVAARTVETATRLTAPVLPRQGKGSDAVIDRALEAVGRRFATDLTDEAVAADLGLSTSHFRHLFREATRQPFQRYVQNLRLEKARELLLQTAIPVTDVARAVGFTSPAHFSRAFARRYGTAPSAMRRPKV